MYSLPGIVREYKSKRMCWAGHVACMGEKKMRMFYCLSTSVYKWAFAFPDSRTKTPKEDSRQNQKTECRNRWLNTRRCAPPIGLLGETSVSKSNMPTTCAERANSTHITLEDGSWRSDTISNSQRTQDLYKWHHNQDLRADAHIQSQQRQKFSLNKILSVTEFTLAGFHIFQHGIKGAVHHDCTTAPFHSYRRYPTTDTRVRVTPAWKCSASF